MKDILSFRSHQGSLTLHVDSSGVEAEVTRATSAAGLIWPRKHVPDFLAVVRQKQYKTWNLGGPCLVIDATQDPVKITQSHPGDLLDYHTALVDRDELLGALTRIHLQRRVDHLDIRIPGAGLVDYVSFLELRYLQRRLAEERGINLHDMDGYGGSKEWDQDHLDALVVDPRKLSSLAKDPDYTESDIGDLAPFLVEAHDRVELTESQCTSLGNAITRLSEAGCFWDDEKGHFEEFTELLHHAAYWGGLTIN